LHAIYPHLLTPFPARSTKPLDDYLSQIADDDAATLTLATADTTGKKRKNAKEVAAKAEGGNEGQKRKARGKTSQGVEKLKKVNVNGMAKLSSFFKKT
jgi:ribonuclease H2 subunit B